MTAKKEPEAPDPGGGFPIAPIEASELQAVVPTFADIARMEGHSVRPTKTQEFACKGTRYLFTIFSDGMDSAGTWSELTSAQMWGESEKMKAKINKEAFGVKVRLPFQENGVPRFKEVVLTDATYLGSMKLLSCVLCIPAWNFDEILIVGEKLGKDFAAVAEWAAQVNGITEHTIGIMREVLKNADTPEASE